MNKEQMIEAIREKAIMANNPKCKTLDEALEREVGMGCIVELDLTKPGRSYVFDERDTFVISGFNKYNDYFVTCPVNLKWYTAWLGGKGLVHDTDKILGLPLTLERVLVALNENKKEIRYVSCGEKISAIRHRDMIFDIEYWQPHKPLGNQSEETIKAIYDILCV